MIYIGAAQRTLLATIWGDLGQGKPVIDHCRSVRGRSTNAAGEMLTLWGRILPLRPSKLGRPRKLGVRLARAFGNEKLQNRTIWDFVGQRPIPTTGWHNYTAWWEVNTIWGKIDLVTWEFPLRPPMLCVRTRK